MMIDQCWEYDGYLNKDGYGEYCDSKRPQGTRLVHRMVYSMYNDGELPSVVMHTCDNPSCYNPRHLVGGTQTDNVQDMLAKGRGKGGMPALNIGMPPGRTREYQQERTLRIKNGTWNWR